MTLEVRDATEQDGVAIAAVARACGQLGEGGAEDPAYVRHLTGNGRFVVAQDADAIVGYAASLPVGGAWMLADLFVAPDRHDRGVGRALLGEVWDRSRPRQTFSSMHPHALPAYVRDGLTPWWPLLCLLGDPAAVPAPTGLLVEPVDPVTAAAAEVAVGGPPRLADYEYWAGRPNGAGVVVRRSGELLAAGAVGGEGEGYGVTRLLALDPAAAADVVLAVVAWAGGGHRAGAVDRRLRVCLPGPHPAVPRLLAARMRIDTVDMFCATDAELVDPRLLAPSPAFC